MFFSRVSTEMGLEQGIFGPPKMLVLWESTLKHMLVLW